jgi:hypothetical protein
VFLGRSVALPIWVKYYVSRAFLFIYLFFWFLGLRTGRTERRTDMPNGSSDAVWRKEVPFGGLVSMQKRIGTKLSENTSNMTRMKGN